MWSRVAASYETQKFNFLVQISLDFTISNLKHAQSLRAYFFKIFNIILPFTPRLKGTLWLLNINKSNNVNNNSNSKKS
jgi:hypothetical protein